MTRFSDIFSDQLRFGVVRFLLHEAIASASPDCRASATLVVRVHPMSQGERGGPRGQDGCQYLFPFGPGHDRIATSMTSSWCICSLKCNSPNHGNNRRVPGRAATLELDVKLPWSVVTCHSLRRVHDSVASMQQSIVPRSGSGHAWEAQSPSQLGNLARAAVNPAVRTVTPGIRKYIARIVAVSCGP